MPDPAVPREPLFVQVLNRRTDRRAYGAARPVAAADLARLNASVAGLPIVFVVAGRVDAPPAERAQIESIRALAKEAWRIELTTEAPMLESMRAIRYGSTDIDRHGDGIAITQPMLVTRARLGLVDRSKLPAPDSQATVAQIKEFNAVTDTTPAYLWLVTEGNSRAQQVVGGRAYVRVNFAGTATGLAMHPNEQASQESGGCTVVPGHPHAPWHPCTARHGADAGTAWLPAGECGPRRAGAAPRARCATGDRIAVSGATDLSIRPQETARHSSLRAGPQPRRMAGG